MGYRMNTPSDIYNNFLKIYDPSRTWQILQKILEGQRLPENVSITYENASTRNFLWEWQGQKIEIAVGQDLLQDKYPTVYDAHWANAMKRVRNLNAAIMPPIELLEIDRTYVIVTVPLKRTPISAAPKSFLGLFTKFSEDLTKKGLHINRPNQVGFFESWPFICDFSSLKPKQEDEPFIPHPSLTSEKYKR